MRHLWLIAPLSLVACSGPAASEPGTETPNNPNSGSEVASTTPSTGGGVVAPAGAPASAPAADDTKSSDSVVSIEGENETPVVEAEAPTGAPMVRMTGPSTFQEVAQ